MIAYYLNKDGRVNHIPNDKQHARFHESDLEAALEEGDPLTDKENSAAPGFRPLLEMTFTRSGSLHFYYGIVFRYMEMDDSDPDDEYLHEGTHGLLRKMEHREYMIVWSDTTVDIRDRKDVDKLLKSRPNNCGACGKGVTRKYNLCESCLILWHSSCMDPLTVVGDSETPMLCLQCTELLL